MIPLMLPRDHHCNTVPSVPALQGLHGLSVLNTCGLDPAREGALVFPQCRPVCRRRHRPLARKDGPEVCASRSRTARTTSGPSANSTAGSAKARTQTNLDDFKKACSDCIEAKSYPVK